MRVPAESLEHAMAHCEGDGVDAFCVAGGEHIRYEEVCSNRLRYVAIIYSMRITYSIGFPHNCLPPSLPFTHAHLPLLSPLISHASHTPPLSPPSPPRRSFFSSSSQCTQPGPRHRTIPLFLFFFGPEPRNITITAPGHGRITISMS